MFTRIPGEMIQFDLRIFFKGVGEKPPTRQQWILPFRPVMSWEVWWCHWGFGEKKRLWVGGSVVQDVRGLVQPFPTKFGPWRINWKPFPKIDGSEGSTRYLYSFPYVFLGAPEKQGLRCLREILVNKYPSLPNSSWGERCLDSWYQLEKGGGDHEFWYPFPGETNPPQVLSSRHPRSFHLQRLQVLVKIKWEGIQQKIWDHQFI